MSEAGLTPRHWAATALQAHPIDVQATRASHAALARAARGSAVEELLSTPSPSSPSSPSSRLTELWLATAAGAASHSRSNSDGTASLAAQAAAQAFVQPWTAAAPAAAVPPSPSPPPLHTHHAMGKILVRPVAYVAPNMPSPFAPFDASPSLSPPAHRSAAASAAASRSGTPLAGAITGSSYSHSSSSPRFQYDAAMVAAAAANSLRSPSPSLSPGYSTPQLPGSTAASSPLSASAPLPQHTDSPAARLLMQASNAVTASDDDDDDDDEGPYHGYSSAGAAAAAEWEELFRLLHAKFNLGYNYLCCCIHAGSLFPSATLWRAFRSREKMHQSPMPTRPIRLTLPSLSSSSRSVSRSRTPAPGVAVAGDSGIGNDPSAVSLSEQLLRVWLGTMVLVYSHARRNPLASMSIVVMLLMLWFTVMHSVVSSSSTAALGAALPRGSVGSAMPAHAHGSEGSPGDSMDPAAAQALLLDPARLSAQRTWNVHNTDSRKLAEGKAGAGTKEHVQLRGLAAQLRAEAEERAALEAVLSRPGPAQSVARLHNAVGQLIIEARAARRADDDGYIPPLVKRHRERPTPAHPTVDDFPVLEALLNAMEQTWAVVPPPASSSTGAAASAKTATGGSKPDKKK